MTKIHASKLVPGQTKVTESGKQYVFDGDNETGLSFTCEDGTRLVIASNVLQQSAGWVETDEVTND